MEGGGGCGGRELGSNGGGRSTKDARKYRGREREKKRKKFTTLYNILEEEMYKEGGTT